MVSQLSCKRFELYFVFLTLFAGSFNGGGVVGFFLSLPYFLPATKLSRLNKFQLNCLTEKKVSLGLYILPCCGT